MSRKPDKLPETLTWEQVRVKATRLGVPAWALAEDLAFHSPDGQLLVSPKVRG